MTKQEEVQFKVMALQVTGGDMAKALPVFAWLIENSVDLEVTRKLLQATQTQVRIIDGQ